MRTTLAVLLGSALSLGAIPMVQAADPASPSQWTDPVTAPAERLPLTASSLLLDIVRGEDRWIAVGERGAIVHSSDGKTWTQSDVPTRATLTAVSRVGNGVWAVGHDGVILHSADAGMTWTLQRSDPMDTTVSAFQRDPRQGAPLLDVLFVDARTGFAVGSYNLMLRTTDGGTTWTPVSLADAVAVGAATAGTPAPVDAADEPAVDADRFAFDEDELELGGESDPHLNGIARTGDGSLFVVSERGSAYRSKDGGETWQRLQLPYDGSMFGVIGYDGSHVLVYGLRGNVFESRDLGDNWTRVDSGTEFSLIGGVALQGEGAALVGANGTVLVRESGAANFKGDTDLDAGALAGVGTFQDGQLLVVGENGVKPVVMP